MADYSPNPLVRAGYHIPHLTNHLGESSLTFQDISTDMVGYMMSILVFPIILVVIGVVSVFIYQLVLMCKCCCKCCCKQVTVPQEDHGGAFIKTITKNNPITMSFFFLFILFAVIANFCVFKSNAYFSNSITQAVGSMADLADIFTDIKGIGNDLVSVGQEMNQTMHMSECASIDSMLGSINQEINSFIYYSDQLVDVVGSFPSSINDAKDTFNKYAQKKNLVVYIYFAVICGIILMLLISSCCKSKFYLNFSIFLTELVVLTLTVIAGAELIVVSLLADFCYSPTQNILSVFDSGSAYDILSYYIECNGLSPFNMSLGNITQTIYEINQTVVEYKSVTPSDCYLGPEIANISYTVDDLIGVISCGPISNVYDEAVNKSICDSFYSGLFVMCITHFLTAGSLYFVLMVISLFHNIYTSTGAANDDDDDNNNEGGYRSSYGQVEMSSVTAASSPTAIAVPHDDYGHVHAHAHAHGSSDVVRAVEPSAPVVKGAYWDVPQRA